MISFATLLSRHGRKVVIGHDLPNHFQTLSERGEIDSCIVSTEEGFSPLGASLNFFSNDLGIPAEEIQHLANWNRFDNERVTFVALGSRRNNGILRGIILAPGETEPVRNFVCEAYHEA